MELVHPGVRPGGWPRRLGTGALVVGGALVFGVVFVLSPLAALVLWLAVLLGWQAARRLEWAALALFFIVPMGRLTWLDDTGTLDVTKLLVAALAAGWGLRCLVKRDRRLVSVWTESPVTVFIMLFLLANVLSLLNTYALGRSLLSLMRMLALFTMYILVVALVRTPRDVKIAVGLLLVGGLVVCLIGLWEASTRQYLWHLLGQERGLPPSLRRPYGGAAAGGGGIRIITVFIDFNFMGGYMAVLLGIAGGGLMALRRWWARLPLVGLILLILYNAVQTGSRGGIVAAMVALLVLLVFSRLRVRWFVLATALAGAIAVFPIVDQIVPQFRGGITLQDLKQDQRYGYWQMALHMMEDSPVIGVGADNFVARYPWYRISPALMERYYCHNIYLQMWAEGGIVGLLAILALVVSVGATYFAALRRAPNEQWRGIVLGLFAGFMAYAVFSASCNTLHDQPFWLLMALSVVTLRATRRLADETRGRSAPTAAAAGEEEMV